MTRLLILLAVPERIRSEYYEHLVAAFPDLGVDLVDHHTKVGPYIGAAEILVTFGAMMADHVIEDAPNPRWIQAHGTGLDKIVDVAARPVVEENIRRYRAGNTASMINLVAR